MIFNLIDGLFLCVIVFLLLKRKVDTSNLKINKNDKIPHGWTEGRKIKFN